MLIPNAKKILSKRKKKKESHLSLRFLLIAKRPRRFTTPLLFRARHNRRFSVLATHAGGQYLLVRTRLAAILALLGLVIVARRQLVAAACTPEAGTVIRSARYQQLLRQEDRQPARGARIPPQPQTRPHLRYQDEHILRHVVITLLPSFRSPASIVSE